MTYFDSILSVSNRTFGFKTQKVSFSSHVQKVLIFIQSENKSIKTSGRIQKRTISSQTEVNNVCCSSYHSKFIISKQLLACHSRCAVNTNYKLKSPKIITSISYFENSVTNLQTCTLEIVVLVSALNSLTVDQSTIHC